MTTNALHFFAGFETGNRFANYKQKEDEVKQGKNYYLSAVPLALQWITLTGLNGRLINYIPHRGARISANVLSGISSCLSLPTALFLACVKHSHYETAVSRLKRISQGYFGCLLIAKLPDSLSNRTIRAVHLLADHAGDMMQVAVVIGGITLSALGQTFFARGLLAHLIYGVLDSRGWVPRKVSLFTETYAPLIGSIGTLYTGAWLGQACATICLATSLFPSAQNILQRKLDAPISWYLHSLNIPVQGPSLEEIDKVFNGPRDLTYQEIKNVINASYYKRYEIHVPHCTNFVRTPNLPKDADFNKLLQFFKAIDWTQKFAIVKAKLSKEDRFIDFIQENYINVPLEELKKNIDYYIKDLAKRKKISKEEYAAKWIESQMSALVNILTGNKRGKGSQKDLQDAINICPEIVAYLQQMSESASDKVEYEDVLLKLALEAGNYCNLGIKRAFGEIRSQVIHKKSSNVQHEEGDPIKQYELQFLQSLQDFRDTIVSAVYKKRTDILSKNNSFFQDTHFFDEYRLLFAFGFYPFTKEERKKFGMLNLIKWKMYLAGPFKEMCDRYQDGLFDKIEENGNEANYILHKIIDQNPNLKDFQRQELRNWYADVDGSGDSKDIERKSRFLLLMTMGVLQSK